jgi:hypothetical protein
MLARADHSAVTAANDDFRLIRIQQSRASWTVVLGVGSALSIALSLFGGLILVTSQALSEPEAINVALARPLATLQIVAGLLLLATLILIPVSRLFSRFGRTSLIEIEDRIVRVRESGLFASRTFAEPLAAYEGAAHRMRTTLSGVQHELILVHPDADRDVVIALESGPRGTTPATMMAQLGLPEIALADIDRARRTDRALIEVSERAPAEVSGLVASGATT